MIDTSCYPQISRIKSRTRVAISPLNSALQRRSPIFRDPHQMQVYFKYSVRAPPVFRYPRSLLGAHALKAVA